MYLYTDSILGKTNVDYQKVKGRRTFAWVYEDVYEDGKTISSLMNLKLTGRRRRAEATI